MFNGQSIELHDKNKKVSITNINLKFRNETSSRGETYLLLVELERVCGE